MNPIARMMKRYIKTPLKYALPLLFIGALVLVSTTGCVSQTATTSANQADITSYPQAGQHSRLVEAFAAQDNLNPSTLSDYARNVQWLNDTTAQVTITYTVETTHYTGVNTYVQFPTIDAATAYFYSLQSQYPQKDPGMTYLPPYDDITGHNPTVARGLEAADATHYLYQTDNVVTQLADSWYTVNQA